MNPEELAICPNCDSHQNIKKGKEFRNGAMYQRYKCKDCDVNFYSQFPETPVEDMEWDIIEPFVPNANKTYVISCAVNDVPLNRKFLATLESYCERHSATLVIVPVKYEQGLSAEGEGYSWDASIEKYFIKDNIVLTNGLKLLGCVNVSPAIGNPLSGFEPFCKGSNLIIPHTQLMLKHVAVSHVAESVFITTTGSISEPIYTSTKQGTRAEFNHSYSAIVIEEDSEIDSFHMRVLNSDESGDFYDIDNYYNGTYHRKNADIPAIVLGDEHVIFMEEGTSNTVFFNEDSIVNVLKPKNIVRHDVLDWHSASHHHTKNTFLQYSKHITGKNNSADELKLTMDYIIKTTPSFSKSVLVSSNHQDHLGKWLNESNPKLEIHNALLYHELMYLVLKEIKDSNGEAIPNPFELWANHNYHLKDSVKFLAASESFKIKDIELAIHGHTGVNGSRGSAEQFSKMGMKVISGHSHSPTITAGSYVVGHTCSSRLGYNTGPSTWAICSCLIQPNGKRQLIYIKGGKWKR